MFFDVFQSRIDYLLHTVHFGPEHVADIVDVAIRVCEPNFNVCKTKIYRPREIIQTLIIDQYADQRGNCWESGCGNRQHQLFGSKHSFTSLPDEFLRAFPFVVSVEHMHDANFLHRDRR
jgi:hypothetical protein